MSTDDRTKLLEALRGFETLMVATTASDGPVARPLAVAEVDDEGEVLFVASEEIAGPVLVTGQDHGHWVSIRGTLDVLHDPERLHALWRSSFLALNPDGPGVLLRLRPEAAELWVAGALGGVRFLFATARAVLDGTAPRDETLEHAHVDLAHH